MILHQYAYVGKGTSIHSSPKIEAYHNKVDDRAIKLGGTQSITTLDGYVIPLNAKNALMRMKLRPYTNIEWNDLPHVILISDSTWNPSTLDLNIDQDDEWYDSISDDVEYPSQQLFDERGNYKNRVDVLQHNSTSIDDSVDICVLHHTNQSLLQDINTCDIFSPSTFDDTPLSLDNDDTSPVSSIVSNTYSVFNGELTKSDPVVTKPSAPDYEKQQPLFAWLPTNIIKKTYELTTQYARLPMSTILKKRYKSPNPALNISRRDER